MPDESADPFEQILSISANAFSAGHYETAYHATMTALHMAKDAGSEPLLHRVADLAEEQGRSIDENSPEHRLASREARARNHEAVYPLAARQARMEAAMIGRRAKFPPPLMIICS